MPAAQGNQASASPHIDVLIVNYRTADLTCSAAAAVDGEGVHIFAWDNSGDLLSHPPPHVQLLGDGTNTYYAPANNALAERCNGEFVLLLNPDVLLSHESLQQLVSALATRPAAWGAAPRLLNPDGSDQHYLQRLPDVWALLADRLPPLRHVLRGPYERFLALDIDLRREQVVEQPPAACLLIRRSRLRDGLFDPQYRLFFNDTDLARRQNLSGECWLIPSVTAVHLRGESFRREKPRTGYVVAREYDRALLRYARHNIPGWRILTPVILGRLLAAWLADRLRAWHGAPADTEARGDLD